MAAKDAAALVANFTTDAVIMAPGVTMKGAEAIRAAMPRMLADPNNKLELIADRVEVADAGDMAATSGKFTRTSTDPATKKSVTAKGSYVTVFRKQQDGAWKMALQIYANDSPSPAPLASRAAARLRKGKKR